MNIFRISSPQGIKTSESGFCSGLTSCGLTTATKATFPVPQVWLSNLHHGEQGTLLGILWVRAPHEKFDGVLICYRTYGVLSFDESILPFCKSHTQPISTLDGLVPATVDLQPFFPSDTHICWWDLATLPDACPYDTFSLKDTITPAQGFGFLSCSRISINP